MSASPRVVALVGDSIVAQMNRLHINQLECDVPGYVFVNLGVTGSRIGDVASRLAVLARFGIDIAVLSVGLNDAAAPEPQGPQAFCQEVERVACLIAPEVVFLAPPTPDYALAVGTVADIDPILRTYRSALDALAAKQHRRLVDPDLVHGAEPSVGRRADGVHLTMEAYDRLLPVLGAAIRDLSEVA